MTKIYYKITPIWSDVSRCVPENKFNRVYNLVEFITDNPETAIDASSWCELATVGEVYEHNDFKIEVVED